MFTYFFSLAIIAFEVICCKIFLKVFAIALGKIESIKEQYY